MLAIANMFTMHRSFRFTVDRAKRMPLASAMSQYLTDKSLDRISKLALVLQVTGKAIDHKIVADISEEADVWINIFTIMTAAPEVVEEIVRNQERMAAE